MERKKQFRTRYIPGMCHIPKLICLLLCFCFCCSVIAEASSTEKEPATIKKIVQKVMA